jgi:integrase/recombinase XerD
VTAADLVPVEPARAGAVEVLAPADPWERWLGQYPSAETRAAYRRDLEQFGAWAAEHGVPVLAARPGDLNAWVAHLRELGRAQATISRKLSAVASFYDWAEDEGLTAGRHLPRRRPRGDAAAPVVLGLGRDEVRAVLAAVPAPAEDATGPAAFSARRLRALVLLLVTCGLRITEAVGADVDQLETVRGHRVITVRGKGGKQRRVPMPPSAAHAIDELLAGRTEGPIFTTSTGGRWDRRDAHRTVARLGRQVGQQLWPHLFRHTNVTLALDAGAPLDRVQKHAGHADPRTTMRYAQGREQLDASPAYDVARLIAEDV